MIKKAEKARRETFEKDMADQRRDIVSFKR